MPFDLLRKPGELPKLVGHRGACDVAPENTMASFTRACLDGADIVELDVRLTADNHVVVIHDKDVERTTNGAGLVAAMTLTALQKLDAGTWFDPEFAGERIPVLDEVLVWAKGKIALMIELKFDPYGSFNPDLVPIVLALIEQRGMQEQVVFISFQPRALQQVKSLSPAYHVGLMPSRDRLLKTFVWMSKRFPVLVRFGFMKHVLLRPLAATLASGCDVVGPNIDVVTPLLVKASHDVGIPVSSGGMVWNYPEAIAMGLDTIGANNPGLIRQRYLITNPD
ncbi:MAG: glycerophosphodiester phosphodiesterase family protein [Anaerolineae bacterium]|nr:glycerophosphodiester phosphodiesterase family protein [Anaerolineae bacterium]